MKAAIVGGGPSGLYLGILLKRKQPDWQVELVEQNAADATFGFGVVLAEAGLSRLQQADQKSYDALYSVMHFNDRQIIVQREVPIEVKQHVKGGAITRLVLLDVLQREAQAAGVKIHFNKRIDSSEDLKCLGLHDADVIVGADGVNSVIRKQFEEVFGTTHRSLTNRLAWYGTNRVFESPALVFRKHKGGYFVAHYYAYSHDMSTFVAECDGATWQRLNMESMSDDERQKLFETIFAPELQGMPLISNKSSFRQFPVIRNARWSNGRFVLVGDALASAHPSIGSGTRIAMCDAIALAEALLACNGDVADALIAFENNHKPTKNKLVSASEKSFTWYEYMAEWMETCTPEQFVYKFMTRTGRIDNERLRAQFPELVERLGDAVEVV